MNKIINLSDNERDLLTLIKSNQTPSHRQAYSDRTSWLMACLSQLAYEPVGIVNPASTKKFLQGKLENLLNNRTKKALDETVTAIYEHDAEATNKLSDELKDYNISIEQAYDHEDTQALLVSTKQFLVLAFRGTEKCFEDFKVDIDIDMTTCPPNGCIHSGFKKAFEHVSKNIQEDLDKKEYADKPLLITGHSLGGALATIASKRLTHEGGIAACYTFGSPRVGDEEWSYGIKTPIYRVVNAFDCVTMLPPSGVIIGLIKLFIKPVIGMIPFVGGWLQKWISEIEGYFDIGDMRYLTSCDPGKYDEVELTYSVSFLRRMRIFFKGKFGVSEFVDDHSISIYREKLGIIALRRNKK